MEKKKLCIKMFIIFASFFMLFILSNSNVFAASDKEFTVHNKLIDDDITIVVPDDVFASMTKDKPYFYIYDNSSNGYFVYNFVCSSNPFGAVATGNEDNPYLLYVNGSLLSRSLYFDKNNSKYYYNSAYTVSPYTKETTTYTVVNGMGLQKSVYYSYDIFKYDVDNNKLTNETVFRKAKEPTQLITIAQSMDFLAVIKEILGILPMILVVLIGLLSLRKAIQLMLKMLHQA